METVSASENFIYGLHEQSSLLYTLYLSVCPNCMTCIVACSYIISLLPSNPRECQLAHNAITLGIFDGFLFCAIQPKSFMGILIKFHSQQHHARNKLHGCSWRDNWTLAIGCSITMEATMPFHFVYPLLSSFN